MFPLRASCASAFCAGSGRSSHETQVVASTGDASQLADTSSRSEAAEAAPREDPSSGPQAILQCAQKTAEVSLAPAPEHDGSMVPPTQQASTGQAPSGALDPVSGTRDGEAAMHQAPQEAADDQNAQAGQVCALTWE